MLFDTWFILWSKVANIFKWIVQKLVEPPTHFFLLYFIFIVCFLHHLEPTECQPRPLKSTTQGSEQWDGETKDAGAEPVRAQGLCAGTWGSKSPFHMEFRHSNVSHGFEVFWYNSLVFWGNYVLFLVFFFLISIQSRYWNSVTFPLFGYLKADFFTHSKTTKRVGVDCQN